MTSGDDAPRLQFVSTSSASDGSFIAISEIGALLKGEPHRLVGDVAVVLHQYRLGIDHPIRATADADSRVPPYALKDDSLVDATLTDGSSVSFDVALPDLASLLGLKLHARRFAPSIAMPSTCGPASSCWRRPARRRRSGMPTSMRSVNDLRTSSTTTVRQWAS